ncbi:MAG: hypothetical protein PVJ66_10290 [Gammaproteobacteria bacterium]|jgi:hypothetical protein
MHSNLPARRSVYRLFALLLAVLLPACAAVDDSKKNITFDKASRYYENALRWGNYEAAALIRRRPDGSAATVNPAALKHIKVTAYEVTGSELSPDHSTIRQDVLIHYYNQDHMTEHTVIDHQTWQYDPDLKTWFLTSPLPAFR